MKKLTGAALAAHLHATGQAGRKKKATKKTGSKLGKGSASAIHVHIHKN